MASQTPDSHAILLRVLEQHSNGSKWTDKPFGKIKLLSNAKVGAMGNSSLRCCAPKWAFGMNCRKRDSLLGT